MAAETFFMEERDTAQTDQSGNASSSDAAHSGTIGTYIAAAALSGVVILAAVSFGPNLFSEQEASYADTCVQIHAEVNAAGDGCAEPGLVRAQAQLGE